MTSNISRTIKEEFQNVEKKGIQKWQKMRYLQNLMI